jgi:hypothetical protein
MAKGMFDMMTPHMNGNQCNSDFVRDQFLMPSPVRFAFGGPNKSDLNVACGSFHLSMVARENCQFQSTLYLS